MNSNIATCQVAQCAWNQSQNCQAPQGITISIHGDHADCSTYQEQE